MSLHKNFTAVKHYIQAIQSLSFASSKQYNHGEISYAYAYGYNASQFHVTLERLNLTKQQLKELAIITAGMIEDTEIKNNKLKDLTMV